MAEKAVVPAKRKAAMFAVNLRSGRVDLMPATIAPVSRRVERRKRNGGILLFVWTSCF